MTKGAPAYDELKLHLRVLGEDREISAPVRVGPTRVMELLPLARRISEGVTAAVIERTVAEGKAISCKAGCAACCRSLVPISPAEAVRLAEVVEAMPRDRRREVKERFDRAVKRMEALGLVDPRAPRPRASLLSREGDPRAAWQDVSRRYFEAKIACPLLEDEACGVYAERPMICREYHVTTPAEMCSTLSPEVRDVPRPTRMSEVMTDVTNELLGREDFSVPLTLALEWAGARRAAFDAEGDGEEMAMTMVRCAQEANERDR